MPSPPMQPIGPPMMCDICGVRLNNFEEWDGDKLTKISWTHTGLFPEGTEPHDPVPVFLDVNDMPRVGFCDFCNSDEPVWAYPAAPFQMHFIGPGKKDSLGVGSCDNWAACQPCKDDIEENRWEKVQNRYLSHKAVPKGMKSALRRDMEALHRAFRISRIGPPFKTVPSPSEAD